MHPGKVPPNDGLCRAGKRLTLSAMTLPTEPIGSIPRPQKLLQALLEFQRGAIPQESLDQALEEAVIDTLKRFEETGSPIITDGEQRKSSFLTYPLDGAAHLAPDGVLVPFADGHTRRLPRLTAGPFRYTKYSGTFVEQAKPYTFRPLKQAVIAASALSLLYPPDGIPGYSRDAFLLDLVEEAVRDIRSAFAAGAQVVQIDFTEARLSLKLDPSGSLLRNFIHLNNRVLEQFTDEERKRIGIHSCAGGDQDSTHSADVDYEGLLPELFQLKAGRFYLQMTSEPNRKEIFQQIRQCMGKDHLVLIGVTSPICSRIETPEEVCASLLEAASWIPADQLGSTDDCGFSPFADDTSTARDIAFAKVRSRVEGTAMAAQRLGLR